MTVVQAIFAAAKSKGMLGALLVLAIAANAVAQAPPVTITSTALNFGSQTVGTSAQQISINATGRSIAAADFNGDGHLDLALPDGSAGVNVSLGNGDGTFQPPAYYDNGIGGNTDFVAVGDINGDGKQDLVVAAPNSFSFSVFLGNGDGTFQTARNVTIGAPTSTLAVADLDGDGYADIACGSGPYLHVFLGSASGNPVLAVLRYYGSSFVNSIATADFNQDGNPDLAVDIGRTGDPLSVAILLGTGTEGFLDAGSVATGATGVTAADMNGDGKADLVLADGVALGNGDGTFQAPVPFVAGWYPIAFNVADFNADGKPDVLAVNAYTSISVLLGNGDGTLQPVVNLSGGAATAAVGDFNGDGKLDFATSGRVVLGNGDGSFQSSQTVVLFAQGADPLVVAGTSIVGANPSDFIATLSQCVGTSLCWYVVEFAPTASGVRTAQLQFSISGYSDPILVNLSGVGVPSDSTPPQIQCAAPDGLWHLSDVTITCTSSDTGSGLANPADASFALLTAVASGTETSNAATNSYQVCDKAGNCATAGPIAGNKVDKKAPAISVSSPTATAYLLNQTVLAQYQCTDGGSGVASCSGTVANNSAINTATVGSKTFTVFAADAVGNTSSATVNSSVTYTSGGTCYGDAGHQILSPINSDGTSVFKQGSTVPAKFRVCDAAGMSVGTAGVVSSFNLVQIISGGVANVNEQVNSTTPDTAFRWDSTGQQWIFNISTKNLSKNASYVYQISLNDGSVISFTYGLK